ncbi:MAG: M23 family metallopeptidase [Flavobacteriales bacterium]|nr:M23 family metallopeptidase [Flavobacteriales bacterium]
MKINTPPHKKLRFFKEVIGLHPVKERFKQAMIAVRGEEDVPPSKAGFSSLQQLHPQVSPKLWRGKSYLERKVIISNLYNHTQTPIHEGWSVAKTQIRDFRGRGLTYNSHNGTDFAIPVGTPVCTAAPGKVVAILSQFNRGGLKIFIDHGQGVMTCYAHLARALVEVGDILEKGAPIALSGYSGLDALLTFPFGIPHVHFNVWHNSLPTDPFPFEGNSTLWNNGNLPAPPSNTSSGLYIPSVYDEQKIEEALAVCKTKSVRERLNALQHIEERATHTIIEMNYYPTRFEKHFNLYQKDFSRKPLLDLPFSSDYFDDVVFLDDLPQMKKFRRWEKKRKL